MMEEKISSSIANFVQDHMNKESAQLMKKIFRAIVLQMLVFFVHYFSLLFMEL